MTANYYLFICFRTKNHKLTDIYVFQEQKPQINNYLYFQDQHCKLTNFHLFQDQGLPINTKLYISEP